MYTYLECPNAIQLWKVTENWIKSLGYNQFKICDTEKFFGEKYNDHLKHIIVISIKDVIYQKRKTGSILYLSDVKRTIQKNIHILKTKDSLSMNESNFDEDWKVIIDQFRTDPVTKKSWYLL